MRKNVSRWLLAAMLIVMAGLTASGHAPLTVGGGRNPALAVDHNGGLYVVFEGAQGGSDICCRYSTAPGQSWTEEINLSRTPGISKRPALVVEPEGALDAVWEDTTSGAEKPEIYFARSVDGGKTWTSAVDLSNTSGASRQPSLAVGPKGSLHCVWTDQPDSSDNVDIYYAYSLNGGKSWSKATNISHTPGVSSSPRLAVSRSSVIHVTWLNAASGTSKVFYVRGCDDQWSKPADVSHSHRMSRRPDIAVAANGRVYLTWAELSHGPTFDIHFSRSEDNGTFSHPLRFKTPGDSGAPCLAVDDTDHVAVAWVDATDNPKKPDVFLAQSGDQGHSFSRPLNISHSPGASRFPRIAIVRGKVIAVWEEVEGGGTVLKMSDAALPPRGRHQEV